MSARGWAPFAGLAALLLACSAPEEGGMPEPLGAGDGVARAGDGGAAGSDGASSDAGGGVAPASAAGAAPSSSECPLSQRHYLEARGFLAAGTVRGLLEALHEPDSFWDELPYCSGEP